MLSYRNVNVGVYYIDDLNIINCNIMIWMFDVFNFRFIFIVII